MPRTDSCDEPFFLPAASSEEAISRMFGLTGRAPDDTRGEKRALVALRDALGLDVDIVRTNAVLGASLAKSLDIAWDDRLHIDRNSLTLAGLNQLLEGAAEAKQNGSLQRLRDDAADFMRDPRWAEFQPARSKIEAVTRIAALTGAPKEWLGPGGKEHKSVLLNLATNLTTSGRLSPADIDTSSKNRLGASLARRFRVPWTDRCGSTGETISLLGLNTVLAGAEAHLGRLGSRITDAIHTPEDEGEALTAALLARLPAHWDGRKAVKWLAERGLRGAHDNEWQGFYGEERAKSVLNSSFTPRDRPLRVDYGHTRFDYTLNYVWDIKVHTEVQVVGSRRREGGNETILNDERATRACIDEQGLGFLIIGGEALMDHTGDFVAWHREFKARRTGRSPAPSNSGISRIRKAAFTPLHVEAFWVPNALALDAAILAGAMKVRPIGRQPPKAVGDSGSARADKFEMHLVRARGSINVARHVWPVPRVDTAGTSPR